MTVCIHQSRADQLIMATNQLSPCGMADRLRSPHGKYLLTIEKDRPRRMQGICICDDRGLNEAYLIQILTKPLWMKCL